MTLTTQLPESDDVREFEIVLVVRAKSPVNENE